MYVMNVHIKQYKLFIDTYSINISFKMVVSRLFRTNNSGAYTLSHTNEVCALPLDVTVRMEWPLSTVLFSSVFVCCSLGFLPEQVV